MPVSLEVIDLGRSLFTSTWNFLNYRRQGTWVSFQNVSSAVWWPRGAEGEQGWTFERGI